MHLFVLYLIIVDLRAGIRVTTARTTPFGEKWRDCVFTVNSVDGKEILNYCR